MGPAVIVNLGRGTLFQPHLGACPVAEPGKNNAPTTKKTCATVLVTEQEATSSKAHRY